MSDNENSTVESVAVPIHILSDGREFITMQDAVARTEVMDFVRRFPSYWKLDILLDGWVGPSAEEEKPNVD